MSEEREKLLKELSAVEFALIDLNLYLDSHIESKEISKKITEYKEKLKELKDTYEEKYGPLESNESADNRWSWIANPWPWENTEESE